VTSRYPAGHLYIHRVLSALTSSGTNLAAAQQIFAALYLLSLTLSCAIYYQAGGVPNWVLLLLPLSKRLHSIYVLRLFNDCWSVVAAQAAILAFARGRNTFGVLLYRCVLPLNLVTTLITQPPAQLFPSKCQPCYTCLVYWWCCLSVLALSPPGCIS
jgi:alpha-1,3-mannosyltransferase